MTNFLALQDQIKTRLRTKLDSALMQNVRVGSAPELSSIDGTHPAPAVFVIFDGYSIAENNSIGTFARIKQTWLAVVAVRSVANIKAGEASREQAGDIASVVLASLMGWKPDGCASPMMLTNPPGANYEDGFFYLPIGIDAEIILKNS